MLEPDAIRLPRIRLRDPRSMGAVAAVAKAGCQRFRLECLAGEWTVTRWCHTHEPGVTRPDWHRTLGTMTREAAIAAFMATLGQLKLFQATVVIGSASAIKP